MPVVKPDNLGLIPGMYMRENKKHNSLKLSSDLHVHTVALTCEHTHTDTQANVLKNNVVLIFVSQTVKTKYHKMTLTIDIYFISCEGWKV